MAHDKLTVRYFRSIGPIVVGRPAVVWPIDHYSPEVSNETWCRTSPVESYNPITGEFTTLNTRYVPHNSVEEGS